MWLSCICKCPRPKGSTITFWPVIMGHGFPWKSLSTEKINTSVLSIMKANYSNTFGFCVAPLMSSTFSLAGYDNKKKACTYLSLHGCLTQ